MTDPEAAEAADPATPPERLHALFRATPALASVLAANPAAPSDLLELLAKAPQSRAYARTLAQHPNTPLALLLILGRDHPDAVLLNPVFPLLTLEGPHVLTRFPPRLLVAMITSTTVSSDFLEWVATEYLGSKSTGGMVLEALARHPLTPPSRLAILAQRSYGQAVRAFVAKHAHVPLATLVALAGDSEVPVRAGAASNPALPDGALRALAEDPEASVRCAAAGNPSLDAGALRSLRSAGATHDLADFAPPDPDFDPAALEPLADRGPWALALVTRHPRATDAMLRTIAAHASPMAQRGVGHSPALSDALRAELAASEVPMVRVGIAEAALTPPALLAALAGDALVAVRAAVAGNPATPPVLLATLARDPQHEVRTHVASNPRTAVDQLATLAEDGDYRVRQRVMLNAATPAAVLTRGLTDTAQAIRTLAVKHAAAPADVVAALRRAGASASLQPVRTIAARATLTPADRALLVTLGAFARRIVAQYPDTPADVLAALARDPDPHTRSLVASHARTPADVLEQLARDANIPVQVAVAGSALASEATQTALARGTAPVVRRCLAATRTTRPSVLAVLMEDSDAQVRQAAARHPNAPAEHVARLVWAGSKPDLAARAATATVARALEPAQRATLAALGAGGPFARELAAHHPDTPAEALDALAQGADLALRRAIASNPATSRATLRRLAMDMAGAVRTAAGRRLAALGAPSSDTDNADVPPGPFALLSAARALDAAPEALAALARHEHHAVRQAVAGHPRCPPEVLAQLAHDASPAVRRALARREQVLRRRSAQPRSATDSALPSPDETPSRS